MEFIEDDTETSQEVRVSSASDFMLFKKEAEESDPFKVDLEDFKKIRGLSTNFKRKVAREFSKAFTGIEGTATQQNLLAQAVTGYAMFDLVEPVYNLEYLSKIYEVSTYNYAAINAKVSNIVGLGYEFVESKKTKEAFDSINDPKQLERARRKLERLKQDVQGWLDSTNDEDTFT